MSAQLRCQRGHSISLPLGGHLYVSLADPIYNSHPVVGITMREATVTDVNFFRTNGTTMRARVERFRIWKDAGRRQSRSVGVMCALFGSQAGESSSRGLAIMFTVGLLDHRRVRGLEVFSRGDDAIRGDRELQP